MATLRHSILTTLVVAALLGAVPAFSQGGPLPRQDIIFVIDNSGSMELPPTPSDPLRLRGVAACLVLDAAELASDVQAGLILFDESAYTIDKKLHPPDVIRLRLQGHKLPPAGGGTNMYDALQLALSMFSGSTAELKRIVLITDGMPNPGQAKTIQTNLVAAASKSNIQIFAIGLSNQVDQAFLDSVTRPTGGRTLISERHQMLLERAKQLIGDQDNITVLVNDPLPSAKGEYQFTIPPGVDRARITTILDHPRDFGPQDITLALNGPATAGERAYTVQTDGGLRVAAWTAFFGTPGAYTLTVRTAGGHKGLRVFVETLSNVRIQLTLNPPDPRHLFDNEVRVLVQTSTSSGSVDPATLAITGVVQTADGGSRVIAFKGGEGTFRVPDVQGRHTVIVKARTAMGTSSEKRVSYEAFAKPPCQLTPLPPRLDFAKALGPTDTSIEADFRLAPEPPDGGPPCSVKVGFIATTPVGEAQIVSKDGGGVKINGPALFTIPAAGAQLKLVINLDPTRPLPTKGGWQSSELRVFSNEAAELTIPFRYQLRIPNFEVRSKLDAFALWWDPGRPRTVPLGTVHSDLETASTFTITLPDAIQDPNRATKIADLSLRANGKSLETEPAAGGKLRYGPIDLEPGRGVDLELVVTPSITTGWQNLPTATKTLDVELLSNYGMSDKLTPSFQTLGPPLMGRISRYGRPVIAAVVVALVLLVFIPLTLRRMRVVRRFWKFRPGRILPLGFGQMRIGDDPSGAAALVLPNSGSAIDDTDVAMIVDDGRKQRIESEDGYVVASARALAAGDVIVVSDDPEVQKELWSFLYDAYDAENKYGEIEVERNPARWTIGRVIRSIVVTSIFILALVWFLGLSAAAALAYRLPLIERLYLHVLR